MTEWRITIELPGPPQGKGRPRFSSAQGFVRVYTPAKTRHYEEALRIEALAAMGRRKPFTGPLMLSVEALFEVPGSWSRRQFDRAIAGAIMPTGRPDADNILKIVGDALNGVCWRDDTMIVTAVIKKRYSTASALVVRIAQEEISGRLFEPTADSLLSA